jgi:D-alanyl-D-alanine carboxypeptidase (penicillin-binding protein 5/6)
VSLLTGNARLAALVGSPRWRRLPMVAIVLPGLLAVLAGAQVARSAPGPRLLVSTPAALSVPGAPPTLPWPAGGQARLDVQGVGTLGGSGTGNAVPIGSVAKVMTAYLVLKDHPLGVGESGPSITITAADVADYHARIPSGQSLVPVVAGEQLTQREALQALLLPSANNIAEVLAAWDAGSSSAFVDKMNATASSLKMSTTHYTDPSGFAPSTVSNAADQTLLGAQALELPAFAEIVALKKASLPVAGTVQNFNSLLGSNGVSGIKTGSTDEAGGNLVFSAHLSVAGQTLIVIGAVLNQPGKNTPEQLAAVNKVTRDLLSAAREVVKEYTVLPAGAVGQVRTAWGNTIVVRTSAPAQIVGWPGLPVTVVARPVRPGKQIRVGQHLGTLTVHGGGADNSVNLLADQALSGPSVWWRLTRIPGF